MSRSSYLSLLCGVAVSAISFAQASAQSPAAPAEVAVEEVVVTGSSIRGVAPVGSPLIGVTRDTIQANAPANTKELLASVPQLGNFGANAEQSTPNRYRTPGFQPNIHNLGMYATLTLVNGHRIAPVGTEAVLPDPSIIPVIAVQRVEIIADGASSVYGSDAVAGVVNFIYRKNVEGLEASATYGWNDTRYRKKNFALLGGRSWDGGNVMAAYEYSENKSPLTKDIPFLALGGDQRSRGGRDLRGTSCPLPNVTVNGATYAYQADGTFRTGRNQCGLLDPKATVIPDGKRHAFLVTAHQQVGDNVTLWSELNYSAYETFRWGGRPSITVTVPNTNPYFRLPAGVTATSETVTVAGLGFFPSARSRRGRSSMA
jgi:iron complex outermembrane receptor protein